jgi:LemA protein
MAPGAAGRGRRFSGLVTFREGSQASPARYRKRLRFSSQEKGRIAMVISVAAMILIGLLAVGLLLVMIVVGMYNRLVTLRNRYKNAFSQIDVQLKRRYDLIPNLVEVAKGYIKHERETLEAVIKARNAAYAAGQQAARTPGDAAAMTALGGAEGQLSGALGRLFAVAEAYPDLKANQNMLALQEELSSTENKIAFARQSYNDAVMFYNTQRELFPTAIIASMFNFQPANLFEVEQPEERAAPKVSF